MQSVHVSTIRAYLHPMRFWPSSRLARFLPRPGHEEVSPPSSSWPPAGYEMTPCYVEGTLHGKGHLEQSVPPRGGCGPGEGRGREGREGEGGEGRGEGEG